MAIGKATDENNQAYTLKNSKILLSVSLAWIIKAELGENLGLFGSRNDIEAVTGHFSAASLILTQTLNCS